MAELGTISAHPREDDAAAAAAAARTPSDHGDHARVQRGAQPRRDRAPDARRAGTRCASDFEILVVDDGSTDGTAERHGPSSASAIPSCGCLRLRRNYGKSTALQAGFDARRGDVDRADGRRRPGPAGGDPEAARALDGGLDLATGRRALRNDRLVKRHTSRLYNRVTAAVTGVEGEDFNCGPEGDAARGHEPARALRRAAPLHPGARGVERLPRRRDRRRARRAPARQLEVRARALLARLPRPPDRQVHHHVHGPPVPPLRRPRDRVRRRRRRPAHVDARAQAARARGSAIGRRSSSASCSWSSPSSS